MVPRSGLSMRRPQLALKRVGPCGTKNGGEEDKERNDAMSDMTGAHTDLIGGRRKHLS